MKKYLTDFPELMGQWDFSKNTVDPSTVSYGSRKKFWWKCILGDDHEWEATPNDRIGHNSSCPCCAGRKVCLNNCLATTHPELIKEWSHNNTITPFEITFGSHEGILWICENGHEYSANLNNRTSNNNTGCPYCVGQKVCLDNCLATLYPTIISQWHPTKNGNSTPYDITISSRKKVWWICEKGHKWEATPNDRTGKNSSCPCCAGRKVCLDNCLATTHPELAKEWSSNNTITPFEITFGSHEGILWICEKGHEYQMSPNDRTNNHSCPCCKASKGEKRIAKYLDQLNLKHKRQCSFDACRNKNKLPFDFIVKVDKQARFLIEYHGRQHYEPSAFGSKKVCKIENFIGVQHRDKIKEEYCKLNDIPLLIIPYWNFNEIEELIDRFVENLITKIKLAS